MRFGELGEVVSLMVEDLWRRRRLTDLAELVRVAGAGWAEGLQVLWVLNCAGINGRSGSNAGGIYAASVGVHVFEAMD